MPCSWAVEEVATSHSSMSNSAAAIDRPSVRDCAFKLELVLRNLDCEHPPGPWWGRECCVVFAAAFCLGHGQHVSEKRSGVLVDRRERWRNCPVTGAAWRLAAVEVRGDAAVSACLSGRADPAASRPGCRCRSRCRSWLRRSDCRRCRGGLRYGSRWLHRRRRHRLEWG